MTLYRKYRPKNFGEIVGQEPIKRILIEEIKSGSIAHAYLFSGPRGTGKTSTARIFAKAINCGRRGETGEPCNECDSCREIGAGRSQDVIEIDAASNRRIDEMRQLREEVRYLPNRDKFKVYIIDEAHMLTAEAFNAFLKTLEEPPSHIVFILATTELHKVPATIFSRCQHFAFTKVPFAQALARLSALCQAENVAVEKSVLEEIVRRSGGALRDAESLLGQILSLGKPVISAEDASLFLPKVGFDRVFGWFSLLVEKKGSAALQTLSVLGNQEINLEFFLDEALELGRQLLIYKVTSSAESLAWHYSPDEIKLLQSLAEKVTPLNLRSILVELLRGSQDMRLSPELPILPIELSVVMICEDGEKEKGKSNKEKGGEVSYSTKSEELVEIQEVASPKLVTNHNLEDILSGWGEVLAKVKDRNQALNFILGVAEPVAVASGIVELGFKFRLQQEKVNEFKNKEIIETILQEVYGAKYRIKASLKDNVELKITEKSDNVAAISGASADDALVRAALEVFDGAVVES